MKYLCVEMSSQTASFRDPEFQNFHRTLPLPPPSTCLGLAGAALGLTPLATQDYFEKNEWVLGIWGKANGKMKDLWKYNDFKAGSVILREYLYENQFVFVYGTTDMNKMEALEKAFQYPAYALTAGNSDSLMKLVSTRIIEATTEHNRMHQCYLEGNVITEIKANLHKDNEISIEVGSNPVVMELPLRFLYESEFGVRRIMERKTLSYIQYPMLLNYSITGVSYKNEFIPVFTI